DLYFETSGPEYRDKDPHRRFAELFRFFPLSLQIAAAWSEQMLWPCQWRALVRQRLGLPTSSALLVSPAIYASLLIPASLLRPRRTWCLLDSSLGRPHENTTPRAVRQPRVYTRCDLLISTRRIGHCWSH